MVNVTHFALLRAERLAGPAGVIGLPRPCRRPAPQLLPASTAFTIAVQVTDASSGGGDAQHDWPAAGVDRTAGRHDQARTGRDVVKARTVVPAADGDAREGSRKSRT